MSFFDKNEKFRIVLNRILYYHTDESTNEEFSYPPSRLELQNLNLTINERKEIAEKLLLIASNNEYYQQAVDIKYKSFTGKEISKRILELIDYWLDATLGFFEDDSILRKVITYLDTPMEQEIRNILKNCVTEYPSLVEPYKLKIIDNVLKYSSEHTEWDDYPLTLKELIDFSALGIGNQRYIESFEWAIRRTGDGLGESWASVEVLKSNFHKIDPKFLEYVINRDINLFRSKKYIFHKIVESDKYSTAIKEKIKNKLSKV